MELEIDPDPDAAEREVIAAAIEASTAAGAATANVWRGAALREGVDDEPTDP